MFFFPALASQCSSPHLPYSSGGAGYVPLPGGLPQQSPGLGLRGTTLFCSQKRQQQLSQVHARVVAGWCRAAFGTPVPTSSVSTAARGARMAGGSAHPSSIRARQPASEPGSAHGKAAPAPSTLPLPGPATFQLCRLQLFTLLLGFCFDSLRSTPRDGVCSPAVPRQWQENLLLGPLSITRPPAPPAPLASMGCWVHGVALHHPWAQTLPVLQRRMETPAPGMDSALPSRP